MWWYVSLGVEGCGDELSGGGKVVVKFGWIVFRSLIGDDV